ncbi:MAG TPA: FAD-dependent oxidoreductase, partial [Arenimonas sp.]|nr:FAD-dependent oxidoreductase [Arenimonas sp.]
DLWDVNVSDFSNDARTSRFAEEGAQEPHIRFVKSLTTKPVVAVGRYTSPDRMASLVKGKVLDFIGAARPSIADPFLPRKIEEGRVDDIRECIGCNVCVSGDNTVSPIRCTQNPSMGEEWRKGWHPERIAPARKAAKVLVVGGGPAGLEAARALGQRGFEVSLAEASKELGGRVSREARLPGLSEWARVRDWRVGQINKMPSVATYLDSRLEAADVLEFGAEHVVIATGSRWRRDGFGRSHGLGIPGFEDNKNVFTPDDLMDGRLPEGEVVVFDDDGGYHATVVAELLAKSGRRVHFVTPEDVVAPWGQFTLEYRHVRKRLAALGVQVQVSKLVTGYTGRELRLADAWSGDASAISADAVVAVTSRLPEDALYQAMRAVETRWRDAGLASVQRIGDCEAPGLIAHAVYAGHALAQGLGEPMGEGVPFRRHFHHDIG